MENGNYCSVWGNIRATIGVHSPPTTRINVSIRFMMMGGRRRSSSSGCCCSRTTTTTTITTTTTTTTTPTPLPLVRLQRVAPRTA